MTKKKQEEQPEDFDFKSFELEAIQGLFSGKRLGGEDGVLTPLIKRFVEKAMDAEMDLHLNEGDSGNRRNGRGNKRLDTDLGPVEIQTPRDRESSFDPTIVPKRSRTLPGALEEQILSMYAKGMSYDAIRDHMHQIYGLDISEAKISYITDQVMEDVLQWQNRPLDPLYVILWLDAIHYKVRQEGRIISKAVYSIMGVNLHGCKEILGLYVGENEGARFWLGILDQLRQRGVEDVLIACIDNLKGFAEAIDTVFPKTDVQACIVHQVRSTTHYVAYKDSKEIIRDMKAIYQSNDVKQAELHLEQFSHKWEKKYPTAVESWNRNWPKLSPFLHYPEAIRKLIYTTNPIESLHSQLRKVTKSKRCFTNDKALLKLLYLVQKDVSKEWKLRPIFRWKEIKAQLVIIFNDRFSPDTLY